jgi:hypothetical protein
MPVSVLRSTRSAICSKFRLVREHLPAAAVVTRQLLEALPLLLLGEVEPELDHQGPVLDQHPLELADAGQLLVQVRIRALAAEAMLDRLQVPAAEQHRDLAARWHGAPEAPIAGACDLLVGLVPERVGLYATGVQPLVEPVDHLAFARALHTGYQHDHARLAGPEAELGIEQRGAQFRHLRREEFLRDPAPQLGRLEHRVVPPPEDPVVSGPRRGAAIHAGRSDGNRSPTPGVSEPWKPKGAAPKRRPQGGAQTGRTLTR